MSRRIGPTRLVNFGPFRDVSFDFSKPGLTCIEGEFVGHGCDDNGSGKSYMLDGIVWILYGRTIRDKVSKDGVVRLLFDTKGRVKLDKKGRPELPPEGCWGEAHVVGGANALLVRRYYAHPTKGNRVELFVNGEDVTQGRDAMTNIAIQEALGLDYDTFVHSVAFGAGDDAKSFFSATDTQRKAIMERILGLELYGSAEKVARARARALATALVDVDRNRATLVARIEEQEEMLSRLLTDAERVERKRELTIARGNLGALKYGRARLLAIVKEAETDVAEESAEARASNDAHEEALRIYSKRKVELEREIRSVERAQSDKQAEQRQLDTQLRRWEELAGRNCPTCTQIVPVQAGKKLQARIRGERDTVASEAARLTSRLSPLRVELRELTEPVPPKSWVLDGARAALRTARATLKDVDARIALLSHGVAYLAEAYEEATSRSSSVEQKLARLRGELTALDENAQETRAELDRAEFWVHGFGNAGIKSFLIEAEIPSVNRVATAYAHRLLGPGAFVQLRAVKDLKSGGQREEMTVEGAIPGCCTSYATASKGQKRRLDLCLLLAFRDVVARRAAKSVDQFFADELFDGLDQTGEEHVVELLRDLAHACPVVLVTHSQGLKSVGDRVLTVRHENGVSEVYEAADGGLAGAA